MIAHRRAAWHYATVFGSVPLQRLWTIGSLNHLHTVESVLRGAGGGAAVLAESRWFEEYLPQHHRPRDHPLSSVSTEQASTTPLIINHTSSFPSVTVSFNLAANMSLSDATRMVSQMQDRLNMPQTVRGFFAGTAAAYQTSLSSEPLLIGTGIARCLHCSRHLVRELSSSSNHNLHLTVGERGRDARSYALQDRSQCDLDHRHYSADRHREENAIMMIDFALVAERAGKTTTRHL